MLVCIVQTHLVASSSHEPHHRIVQDRLQLAGERSDAKWAAMFAHAPRAGAHRAVLHYVNPNNSRKRPPSSSFTVVFMHCQPKNRRRSSKVSCVFEAFAVASSVLEQAPGTWLLASDLTTIKSQITSAAWDEGSQGTDNFWTKRTFLTPSADAAPSTSLEDFCDEFKMLPEAQQAGDPQQGRIEKVQQSLDRSVSAMYSTLQALLHGNDRLHLTVTDILALPEWKEFD